MLTFVLGGRFHKNICQLIVKYYLIFLNSLDI